MKVKLQIEYTMDVSDLYTQMEAMSFATDLMNKHLDKLKARGAEFECKDEFAIVKTSLCPRHDSRS